MKTTFLILLALCTTSFYSIAQDVAEPSDKSDKANYWGFGVSADPISTMYGFDYFFGYSGFGLGSQFQFPINISRVRLEPELGFIAGDGLTFLSPGFAAMANLKLRDKFYVLPGVRTKLYYDDGFELLSAQILTQFEYRPIEFFGFGVEPNISTYWQAGGNGLSELEFSNLVHSGVRFNFRFYF